MSEAKKKMTEEEILKSLDAIIEETMGKDEEVVKSAEESKDENKQANGGEDKIKSGSPMSEEQKAEEAKKAKAKKEKEDAEKEKAMKDKEEAEKAAPVEADLKKADDKDADDKKDSKEKDDKDEDNKKKDKKKNPFMKKSLEELSAVLDEEELELVKAWREENSEEETEQSSADIAKSVAQAVGAQLEDIKKSFDQKLSEKDDMIKSLSEKVNKLSTQPAHGRQSVDSLETIEKSGSSTTEITKSQVLDTMLELQKAGKGINSQHIAEFEATRNLSNAQVKAFVMSETKKRFQN